MLSLSTAKSGALIGVLISVTTIPAAANIGIAAALGDWDTAAGSAGQLVVNLAASWSPARSRSTSSACSTSAASGTTRTGA